MSPRLRDSHMRRNHRKVYSELRLGSISRAGTASLDATHPISRALSSDSEWTQHALHVKFILRA